MEEKHCTFDGKPVMCSEPVLRLAAKEGNPRNSEGAFLELKDGSVIFAYSRFDGESFHDHESADIAVIRSMDCGRTWSEPEILIKGEKGFGNNFMSVTLLRLQNGRICLMYLRKADLGDRVDCRPMIQYSDDEGESWSEAKYIIGATGYYVVNNDRMIQTGSGRLLIAAAQHRWKGNQDGRLAREDGRAIGIMFYSDDNGENWQEAPDWVLPSVTNCESGLQEPGLVELEPGRIMFWARTDHGCQYKAFSYDDGMNWTDAIPAPEFPSPNGPLSIKRDPVTGDLVAVWCDISARYGVIPQPCSWGRTPYVMAFSSDNGRTWKNHFAFEKEPDCGYCYCAINFNRDGSILLGYCSGGQKYQTVVLQDTSIRRFTRCSGDA
ncbi:MAG: exo-alpha-sialidase [Lentisphaeria bacterium]|nr:exo-alpha-sialidase [Lentisphaeria bacterium]